MKTEEPAPLLPPSTAAWLCLIFGVATTLLIIGRLLYLCGAGVDFSDEGYYLNSISHHELYPVSATQFGFVYSPLYRLLGGNFILLRQANILITFACAWVFFSLLLLGQRQPRGCEHGALLALAFIFSVSALAMFRYWLPTPNYNTLTFQGLLLGGCGFGLLRRNTARTAVVGYVLLGAAGTLVFLAKPTAAVAAATLFLASLMARRNLGWRSLLIVMLAALLGLAIAAWMIDLSFSRFLMRLTTAATDAKRLQSTYTLEKMLRIDDFALRPRESLFLWAGAVLSGCLSWLAVSDRRGNSVLSAILALASLAALGIVVGTHFFHQRSLLHILGYDPTPLFAYSSLSHEWLNVFPFTSLVLLAWPLGAFAVLLARFRQRPDMSEIGVAACFVAMPYAYVFGTNGNYWSAMGGAAAFWCAGSLLCLGASSARVPNWPQFLPLGVAVIAGTVLVLIPATEVPYRQSQPLRENTTTITVANGSRLRVPADIADYIHEVRTALEANGFKPGDPIIDLTGHYPTLLYLVGAKPIGLAWLLGGSPGSEDFARQGLDRVPPGIRARAWVLSEADGPRRLSTQLLHNYGLDLERDYLEVGTFSSPVAEFSKTFEQHLFKPRIGRTAAY